MKPLTRDWAKKAENDFKVASQILRRRKDIVPDAACFFCQQCVEKYLKARLLETGIAFPRTHDLLQLLNLCLQLFEGFRLVSPRGQYLCPQNAGG